jgi:hypothetical protein
VGWLVLTKSNIPAPVPPPKESFHDGNIAETSATSSISAGSFGCRFVEKVIEMVELTSVASFVVGLASDSGERVFSRHRYKSDTTDSNTRRKK